MIYNNEKFTNLRAEVEQESEIVNKFLRDILRVYSHDLDELVNELDIILLAIKNGDIEQYTDGQLEYYSMKLPILMYNAGSRLGELGANSDVAKANRKKLFNSIVVKMKKDGGTVAEKKAIAETMIESEQMVEDLYSRAYSQLKIKLEYADGVFTSIKKVISKRMLDLEVFRKDLGKTDDIVIIQDNSIEIDDTWKEYKAKS